MKAIVTGGAGFIGSHLVDRLLKEKNQVLIIDDLSTGKGNNLNAKAQFLKLDIRDKTIDNIFLSFKPDYVFHLAAQIDVRKSLKDPLLDQSINIGGTVNIIKASIKARVKKLIFSSTGGAIYGDKEFADEKTIPEPMSAYGISKLSAEHYLRVFGVWQDLNYTILRYGNVYGPRQDPYGEAGVVAIFSRALIEGENPILYGFGKMKRDYVFVEDVVSANILSIHKGGKETFNISSGIETSVEKLLNLLQKITHKNTKPVYKPKREGEVDSISLNVSKAKEKLGWSAQFTFEEGLKRTFNWFKEHL